MLRHQHCWWLSLKCPSPILSFALDLSILEKLHTELLPKLGDMKTFPKVIRSVPAHFGGFNLYSAEVEALVQALHNLILLHAAGTLTRLLLKTMIEYHQLELGTDRQLFSLSFDSFGLLGIKIWITSL